MTSDACWNLPYFFGRPTASKSSVDGVPTTHVLNIYIYSNYIIHMYMIIYIYVIIYGYIYNCQ